MFFPMLKGTRLQRVTETKLPGLDRRESAATPGFREMENLCSEGYPALRTRPGRGLVETLKKPNGLLAKDALLWVDGKHLYMNGLEVGPELTDGEKSLVSMGAYVVVFPDKVYVNTQDVTDCGSLECERTAPAGSGLALCDETGTAYSGVTESAGAPEEPREGALWLDLSGTEPVLRQYSREVWTALEGVCVKVQATGIGTGFAAGDGVEVSGCSVARLNGETVLQAADTDWVAFPGTVAGGAVTETAMKLRRFVPEMDYVVQSGNRLWGCKYGMVDGKPVNEILSLIHI